MNTHSYSSQKFGAARRSLMPPFWKGLPASVADAFHEAQLGWPEGPIGDDWVAEKLDRLERYMDTAGITPPPDKGAWEVKAAGFTDEEIHEVCDAIDSLADWFGRQ